MDSVHISVREGIESDESSSVSVRVEYDSLSSSHEDIDEYPQCKDMNLVRATERQRQMLRERGVFHVPDIKTSDTYFELIGSMLKRSLYLSNVEKDEESSGSESTESNCSVKYSKEHSTNTSSFLRKGPSLSSSSPRKNETSEQHDHREDSLSPSPDATQVNSDICMYELHDRREDKLDLEHCKQMLNEDILDEIRCFVNQYNEQEDVRALSPPANCNEDSDHVKYETSRNTVVTVNVETSKNTKSISKRNDCSFGKMRKQSKCFRGAAAKSNSPVRRKHSSKHVNSGLEHDLQDDGGVQWEVNMKNADGNKYECRSACRPGDLVQSMIPISDRLMESSDSDQTIVPEIEIGNTVMNAKRTGGRSGKPVARTETSSTYRVTPHHALTNQCHDRVRSKTESYQRRQPSKHFVPSENPSKIDQLVTTKFNLIYSQCAKNTADLKVAQRANSVTNRVPMNSLLRAQARSRRNEIKLAEKNLDSDLIEKRRAKGEKRIINCGPMNSLLRAEARAKVKNAEDAVKSAANVVLDKGRRGEQEEVQSRVPLLLWSNVSRSQSKKRATKKHQLIKSVCEVSKSGLVPPIQG